MESARRPPRQAATLRGYNLERLLSVTMSRPGPFTRGELIDATGLSAPTVGQLASNLIARGLASDLGPGPSSGGRRPSLMEFNARHGFVAGIDIGPTRTRLAIADLRGHQLAHRIVCTPAGIAPASALQKIAGEVRSLMQEAAVPLDRLKVVGAGAPGPVDVQRGVVMMAPNIEGWSAVPMRAVLEAELGARVRVENDVNLALLGEHWQGAARGHQTCAFLFVGTGIGAAVLIDGEIHRGHHFMAGEIAVMCMGREHVGADFGSRGCLETLASLHALAARWPQAGEGDPEEWLPRLFAAAQFGDSRAQQALDETATLLAIAAANIVTVVDPSVILLGGALFANAEPLVRQVREIVERIARAPTEIALAALGRGAPLAGCVLLAATDARNQLRRELLGRDRREQSQAAWERIR